MKITKNYEEAVNFLKNLPQGTIGLDVIISYSTDTVEITYTENLISKNTPHFITNLANQYIQDIEKAINKEHENVKLEVPNKSETQVLTMSFKTALEFLKTLPGRVINELSITAHDNNATVVFRENCSDQHIDKDDITSLCAMYEGILNKAIQKAEERKKEEKEKLDAAIKENPMPKVKNFIENLLIKLDEIDLSTSIAELKTKAGILTEEQAYDKWADSEFGQSVIEMKKLLESLDAINEDSFLERIKAKVQAYNRQVLALRETRSELNKMFNDMPNKEKFSVNYDNGGFVDVVQMPSVHLIKRVNAYVTHGHDSVHIYESDSEGYYSVVKVEQGSPITNQYTNERIITVEEVPFERFTITKSGTHIFAVEVIDKPVF